MYRFLVITLPLTLITGVPLGIAQTPDQAPIAAPRPRPTPPTRDPHTAGYVAEKELPDGASPSANLDGNFIMGPTHNPAPEMIPQEGV